jgi:hypothetical protein
MSLSRKLALAIVVAVAVTGCASLNEMLSTNYRASWQVAHDHGDGWAQPCKGTLYITHEGNIGYQEQGTFFGHGFVVPASQVVEAKKNRMVGSSIGAFHVRLASGQNYNFAIVGWGGTYMSPDDALRELNEAIAESRRGY